MVGEGGGNRQTQAVNITQRTPVCRDTRELPSSSTARPAHTTGQDYQVISQSGRDNLRICLIPINSIAVEAGKGRWHLDASFSKKDGEAENLLKKKICSTE